MNTRDQHNFLFRFGHESQNLPKKRSNSHAALSFEGMCNTLHKANEVAAKELVSLDDNELIIWNTIMLGNKLSQDIISCDLPTDNESKADLVKFVQNNADTTLRNREISWLMKILQIAIQSKQYGFGNCQEKAFFGFACMLSNLPNQNLLQSLRLATFKNHFIVIVNERFLMDPWLNLAFPLKKDDVDKNIHHVFKNYGALVDYFEFKFDHFNLKPTCIKHEVVVDAKSRMDDKSNKDTPTCLLFLASHHDECFLLPKQHDEDKKQKHNTIEEKNKEQNSPPLKKQKATEDHNQKVSDHKASDFDALDTTSQTISQDDTFDSDITDINITKPTDKECDDFLELFENEFDSINEDTEMKPHGSLQQAFTLFQPQPQFNIQPTQPALNLTSTPFQNENQFNPFDPAKAGQSSAKPYTKPDPSKYF